MFACLPVDPGGVPVVQAGVPGAHHLLDGAAGREVAAALEDQLARGAEVEGGDLRVAAGAGEDLAALPDQRLLGGGPDDGVRLPHPVGAEQGEAPDQALVEPAAQGGHVAEGERQSADTKLTAGCAAAPQSHLDRVGGVEEALDEEVDGLPLLGELTQRLGRAAQAGLAAPRGP
jgi:hypothetical protein